MSKIETRDFTPWTRDFLIELETRRVDASARQDDTACQEILTQARQIILDALGQHVRNDKILHMILYAVHNRTPIIIELEPKGY